MDPRHWKSKACLAMSLLAAAACHQTGAAPEASGTGASVEARAERSEAAPAAASSTPRPAPDSVQPHDATQSGAAANFDTTKSAELLTKRVSTGHLLVQPLVNGMQAGWFIFDTGAGICVVSTPHVEALQLEAAGDIAARGIAGAEQAKLYSATTLELGPLSLRDHPLMVTDLSFLKAFLGEEIVGVIGFGVLSKCVAEIDPREQRIALFDPASFTLQGAEWVAVDLDDRIPALRARFEDREGLFHIDTGANSGVSFTAKAVERWKLLEGREVKDAKLGGVGGFIAAKRGTLAWFEIGGLRQEQVVATFPLESKGVLGGERIDGSLGAEVLRPFVLVTDYARERVAFRARRD